MYKKTRLILFLLLALALVSSVAAGAWYWYDGTVDRSGWVEKDGTLTYQDFHADPVSGWLSLDEGSYFLSDGIPRTGWQKLGGTVYHFDETGLMETGWLETDGRTYYLGSDGGLTTGWAEIEGNTHFFDEEGVQATGWLELDGCLYYLPEGTLATGWQDIEGLTYYLNAQGIPVTGQTEIDGIIYCFREDGVLLTGWDESHRTYYLETGAPATGWQEIDGKLYFFDESGIATTGWMYSGEYRWYFYEDGSAAVGPADIDGVRRYFTPKGIEVILVNALNAIPEDYTPDLVNVTPNHQVAYPCYDALVQMLTDCEAAGIGYTFNSAYRTHAIQTAILEENTQAYMDRYEIDYWEALDMALAFVAVPGTSEHQLGLAVDMLGEEAVPWFNEHCWDYGFIRRYTAEKESITGIIDEPWHFRYVGKEVALDIKDSGLCLEEYLGAQSVKG